MHNLLFTLVALVGPADIPQAQQQIGWLWPRTQEGSYGQAYPYVPREGDLVFYTFTSTSYSIGYPLARSWQPYHVGLVVRRWNGSLTILEAGGANIRKVCLFPIGKRLCPYHKTVRNPFVWIRSIACPLSPEESTRLTCFAESQLGKPFATARQLARLLLPNHGFKVAHPGQKSWYCSEIVGAALTFTGIIPRDSFEPSKTLPRDMFFDRAEVNLSQRWHPPIPWNRCPKPPPPGPCCAPR